MNLNHEREPVKLQDDGPGSQAYLSFPKGLGYGERVRDLHQVLAYHPLGG
jgi:hypothetical protein